MLFRSIEASASDCQPVPFSRKREKGSVPSIAKSSTCAVPLRQPLSSRGRHDPRRPGRPPQNLGENEIAGTITLVYDHHKQHVQATLTDIQHDHHEVIISTLHVHLDHHNCLEVLVVRGKAATIKKIADELIAAKGVKHGKLTVTSSGKDLPA